MVQTSLSFISFHLRTMNIIWNKAKQNVISKTSTFPLMTGVQKNAFCDVVACENIRFSSLFAAGDVSRGGTSATQRQKFHTDDVKSVRNPVRSADWSTQQFHCFSYCLWMTDKKQKATKVKCKRKESLTKQSIFVEYRLLLKKHLNFAGVREQINTTLYQNRPEDTQN